MKLFIYTLILVSCFAVSCKKAGNKNIDNVAVLPNYRNTQEPLDTTSYENFMKSTGREVLKALQEKSYQRVFNDFGLQARVLFSPYPFIDTTISRAYFTNQVLTGAVINWGKYDGSGEDIKLNFENYCQKFVYDKDFLRAKEISVNKSIKSSNTQDNMLSIYPKAQYVEYYVAGSDSSQNDWATLRLVFLEEYKKPKLVAIIHNQPTI